MMGVPNIYTLEIDITYRCGMKCRHCNRFCDIFPGSLNEEVTLEQIDKLIRESKETKYPWRKWWLIGGEPTLHRRLWGFVEKIAAYRDWRGPEQFAIGIATHGYGPDTQRLLRNLVQEYPFLEILNSNKKPGESRDFVTVLDAAIDRFPNRDWATEEWQGCGVSWRCGIGMNYAGFFPCCVAGAMHRIAGIGQPLEAVGKISIEAMKAKYAEFCGLCGYYLQESKSGIFSKTWQAILGDRVKLKSA